MKKILIGLLTLSVAMSFSSCMKTYYQVSTTKPLTPNVQSSAKDGYVYEDENVKITLDMWKENGRRTIVMHNKTDRRIYLDWEKSSVSTNDTTYAINDLTNTTVDFLSPNLIIPAHKCRSFVGFIIEDSVFQVEGLKEKVRHSESMSFEPNESPLRIGYEITYCFDNHQGEKTINLDFYVARITNYSVKSFYTKEKVKTIVNGKVYKTKKYVQTVSPKNGYYVKYQR